MNLAIEGYTDTTGTPDYNLKLSQQRADAVRDFLVAQGMSPDTISAKGLGQDNPVADNSTATGRKRIVAWKSSSPAKSLAPKWATNRSGGVIPLWPSSNFSTNVNCHSERSLRTEESLWYRRRNKPRRDKPAVT